jgi:hypothetical protein
VKTFQIYYFFRYYILQPKRTDLYGIWQEEIGIKSEVQCQHVQNVVLSHINVEKLSEEEVKNIRQSIHRF